MTCLCVLFKLIGPTLSKCLRHLQGSTTSPDPPLTAGEDYANRTNAVCLKANICKTNISSSTNSASSRYFNADKGNKRMGNNGSLRNGPLTTPPPTIRGRLPARNAGNGRRPPRHGNARPRSPRPPHIPSARHGSYKSLPEFYSYNGLRINYLKIYPPAGGGVAVSHGE